MRIARALCLALVLPALALADERVELADTLLADESGFERATELYRQALAETPGADDVRLRLARVLAWQQRYDESLVEYGRLLEADPVPEGAAVERAEVLSWAARYDEALAAFEALLAEEPEDARAARGLARTLAWSGRKGEADAAFERALALEEDPETRRQWAVLRDGSRPGAEADAGFTSDSDDFERFQSHVEAGFYWDLDTRIFARGGFLRVEQPGAASDRGYDLSVGASRRFSQALEAAVEIGARAWERSGARFLGSARVQYTTASEAVLGAELSRGDALEWTDSVLAVDDELSANRLRTTLWKGFGDHFDGFAELGGSLFDDGNLRSSAGLALGYRPWTEHGLRLVLSGGWLGYADESDVYYDPSADAAVMVRAVYRQELWERITLDFEGGGGFGYARQDGVSGSGPQYDVAAGLSWNRHPWRFALRGGHSRSQRRNEYTTNRATALVALDF